MGRRTRFCKILSIVMFANSFFSTSKLSSCNFLEVMIWLLVHMICKLDTITICWFHCSKWLLFAEMNGCLLFIVFFSLSLWRFANRFYVESARQHSTGSWYRKIFGFHWTKELFSGIWHETMAKDLSIFICSRFTIVSIASSPDKRHKDVVFILCTM